jgi:hypothetical protein
MKILYQLRDAMFRFMYGRNGMDELNRALLGVYLAVYLLGAVMGDGLLGKVFYLLSVALSLTMLFRVFSKDLAKRREENRKFAGWFRRFKSSAAGAKQRHADKDHKYFTCKTCGTICRVPVGKGKIVITCPKCSGQIQAKS